MKKIFFAVAIIIVFVIVAFASDSCRNSCAVNRDICISDCSHNKKGANNWCKDSCMRSYDKCMDRCSK